MEHLVLRKNTSIFIEYQIERFFYITVIISIVGISFNFMYLFYLFVEIILLNDCMIVVFCP